MTGGARPVPLHRIQVDDPFWNPVIELVRREVLPYQYEALHDRIDGAEKSYCIDNFIKAGRVVQALQNGKSVPTYPVDKWCYDDGNAAPEAFHGWVFQDSDAYKWLEAAAYSLISRPDSALAAKADGLIDLICAAQLPNGYLDTLYIINDRGAVFTNLRDFHELYCFGHLAEAAVAYYVATGKTKLLAAARRFADLICDTFGEADGKKRGYGGHELAELALVRLFEATGEQRYLDTARFLIRERGTKPYYFDRERGKETEADNYFYHQAHTPPVHQHEAVGHAVRGVYLYSGMADVARLCHDSALAAACQDIWENIETKKLYITGGIGATVHGEAFSFDYDLPNDLAYCETCASVGLIFFAQRMARLSLNARYGAVAERALYNTVLAGMGEDGKHFFYVNPLEVLPQASAEDERKRHVKPVRQPWFSCACCPPNLARLIGSVGAYAFAESADTVLLHQYIGATVQTENGVITVDSDYCRSGRVTVTVRGKQAFTLAARLPEWCDSVQASQPYTVQNGYMLFAVNGETVITLDFPVQPKLVRCSNRVRENVGKAAVTCGPFVYCAEAADNGDGLQRLVLSKNGALRRDGDRVLADGWREQADDKLYIEYKEPARTPTTVTLIPYYRWGNRGENEMQVYLRI